MALAILELVDFGNAVANFNIDTGTNRNYVLKIGRNFQNRNGIDWIDDVTYSTAPATNENGGSLFRSGKQVAVPVSRFADGANFVQLFSFKGPDHRSPAFSSVVEIPGRIALPPDRLPIRRSYRASMSLSTATFQSARRVPCRTATDVQAQSMSIDDVLASVVKLATPLVETLLNAKPNGAATADAGGGKNDALANVLAVLLRSILGDGKAPPAVAGAKSLSVNGSGAGNRFANGALSHPFIFGIDDALIGALAGPVLQLLPQLMNLANQRKIQTKQADNRLISDILSDINRRMLLQQLAGAQPANAGATPTSPELANLVQLLQQAPAAPANAGAAPPPATAQSLAMEPASGAVLSSRAVLGFAFADPLPWNGSQKPLFVKGAIRLRVRLNVGNPAPKSVLPRVILKVAFKDPADHSVLLEKTFKQKDVAANSSVAFDFTADELAPLPGNQPIDVVAEMRWRTAKNGEYKALGSSEIVLIGKYLLKSQGSTVSTEVELTDMTRFRPFWNKVWESPVLDSAGKATDDNARYLWELAAYIKYSVLPSADHDANGLMETKLLKGPEEPESLSNRTSGRMKAGIELSLTELNKLLPLWNGQAMLEPVKLAALQTAEFAKANAGELITSVKLSGKAGERGMVWAIPVFNLTECTLSSIAKTDESGQVTALSDETIRFPLPVSVRLIGLKSRR
jgi:hypothetical protein